ncbi:MAG: alpha-N-acetylglucosaminidase C-terminal domain-containing protein [Rhodanobacter sp.]
MMLSGARLAPLRASAGTDPEAAQREYDRPPIITSRGDRSASDRGRRRGYANRHRAGLMGGLYAVRSWRHFDSLQPSLEPGRPLWPIDWFAMEQPWARA